MLKLLRKQFKITNIMAVSVDGKIASHAEESTAERNKNGMVCPADFLRLKTEVAKCDCVFVSAKSIEVETGAFRISHLKKNLQEPEWIVFTKSGTVSFSHPFWAQKNIPKALFQVTDFRIDIEPKFEICEIKLSHETINFYIGNISGLIHYLISQKKSKFALLGGGKLNAAFWEQNLVNYLKLTLSPLLLGKSDLPSLVSSSHLLLKKLKCEKLTKSGHFIFIDYKVQ